MTRQELVRFITENPEVIADYIGYNIDVQSLRDAAESARRQEKAKLESDIPKLETQITEMRNRLSDLEGR